MKKILLATGNITIQEETVRYSVNLAQRLRAGLEVLQVFKPSMVSGWRKVLQKLSMSRELFEGSMVAATFAEAGEFETAKLARKLMSQIALAVDANETAAEDAVEYHVTFRAGNPEQEIVRFVEHNHDVVLTIYDAAGSDKGSPSPEQLKEKLGVPMVTVEKKSR